MATSSAGIEQQSGCYGNILLPDDKLFQECPKTIANCNSGNVGKESYFWQRPRMVMVCQWSKVYLPSYQDGEDASTMDAHRERLHDQYNLSSTKRDQRIIRKLMDLTFPHRTNLLMHEMVTIREVTDL